MAALVIGWSIVIALSSAVLLSLGLIARVSRGALGLAGVAIALALAGYAWQGHPELPSATALALRDKPTFNAADARAHPMMPAFTREDMALNTADAMVRARNIAGAVALLKNELVTEPRNAQLWNGLGKALVANGDGLITPAALFAFDRAAAIDPTDPIPKIMHALALAQNARFDESAQLMAQVLSQIPKNSPLRPELEEKLAQIRDRLR